MNNNIIHISQFATMPTITEMEKENIDIAVMLRHTSDITQYGSRILVRNDTEPSVLEKIKQAIKKSNCIHCEDEDNEEFLCFTSNNDMPQEMMEKIALHFGRENVTINYD